MSLGTLHLQWPDGRTLDYEMVAPVMTVGRAAGNELVIEHESVARRHARITVEARRLLIEDLGSASGTFIAGIRVPPNAPNPMTEFDRGRFGDVSFKYEPARISPETGEAVSVPVGSPTTGPTASTYVEATPPPAAPARPGVPLTARLDAPRELIEPGNKFTATLTVVNQSDASVDVRLHVSGIPAEWARLAEERITLLPGTQHQVPLTVRIPRTPAARAGDHRIQVSAFSRKFRTGVTAEALLRIRPFAKFEMRLDPPEGAGEFILNVENQGNAPTSYRFSASDDEGVLKITFAQPAVTLKPGQRGAIPVVADALRRRRFGATRYVNFNLVATPMDGPGVETVEPGLVHLSPIVPLWLAPVIGVLLICLCISAAYGFVTICPNVAPGLPFCPGGNPPVVNIFAATPNLIEPGASVVISWDVAAAVQVDIEPDIGLVESSGVRTVNPQSSVRYVLTAVNDDGSTKQEIEVAVQGVPPTVAEFSAQPAAVLRGQVEKVVLTWSAPGADSVIIVGVDQTFEGSGSTTVPVPGETITYTLLAGNATGQVQAELTIPVTDVACRVVNLAGGQALPLREGPGDTFREIIALGNDTMLTPINRTSTGEWVHVQVAEREGWVSTLFVTCDVDLLTFSTASPEQLPVPPTATFAPTETATATVAVTGTQPPTAVPTDTATPTATLTPTATTAPPTATPSGFTSSPPTVDGIYGVGEWNGAQFVQDLPNGKLYFMNDSTNLYLLLDVTGDTGDDPPIAASPWGDYFWLTFDVNENGIIDASTDTNYVRDVEYQFYLGPGSFSTPTPSSGAIVSGFGATPDEAAPHRFWEFSLEFAEIQAAPGEQIRLGLRTYSQTPAFTDDTPANFTNDFSGLIEFTLGNPP